MSLCNFGPQSLVPVFPAPSLTPPSFSSLSLSLDLGGLLGIPSLPVYSALLPPISPLPSLSLPLPQTLLVSIDLSGSLGLPGIPAFSTSLVPVIPAPSLTPPTFPTLQLPMPFCPLD